MHKLLSTAALFTALLALTSCAVITVTLPDGTTVTDKRFLVDREISGFTATKSGKDYSVKFDGVKSTETMALDVAKSALDTAGALIK